MRFVTTIGLAVIISFCLLGHSTLAQGITTSADGSLEIVTAVPELAAQEPRSRAVNGGDVAAVPDGPELLFESGPLLTCTDCVEGFDGSELQNASLDMSVVGFGNVHNPDNETQSLRIADQFEVTGDGWHIDHVQVFGYQPGSGTTSTFTTVTVRIWDGVPGEEGAQVVFGDGVTNRMVASAFTGLFRVTETQINQSRPIMVQTAAMDVFLPAGTYWLDWAQAGTLPSGAFLPPITISGQCVTGSALRWLSDDGAPHAWVPAIDANSACPQGMPFGILGQMVVSGEPGPETEVVTLQAFPNPLRTNGGIVVNLPDATAISLSLYDLLGRPVVLIADGDLAAGEHAFAVDAGELANGVYVLRLTAGEHVHTRRITVIR